MKFPSFGVRSTVFKNTTKKVSFYHKSLRDFFKRSVFWQRRESISFITVWFLLLSALFVDWFQIGQIFGLDLKWEFWPCQQIIFDREIGLPGEIRKCNLFPAVQMTRPEGQKGKCFPSPKGLFLFKYKVYLMVERVDLWSERTELALMHQGNAMI